MSRQITKTIYTLAELTGTARENALQKLSEWATEDSFYTESVYEDAARMGELMGIDLNTKTVKLMGGGTRQDPCIYFSGFSSQGDGACFEGNYRYQKGAVRAITAETGGTDTELIRIARELQQVQAVNFYQLRASTSHRGHYYHSGCMAVNVGRYDEKDFSRDTEEEVTQLLRDFADWIYKRLEQEYDYQTSEEVLIENAEANGYEFDEHGRLI